MTHPLAYLEQAIAKFKEGCTQEYQQTPEPQLSDELLGGLVALYCQEDLSRLKAVFKVALEDSRYEDFVGDMDYWEDWKQDAECLEDDEE